MSIVPEKFNAQLKAVYPMTWQEIFAVWRLGEAHNVQWKEHWEARGFDSWDQWRSDYISGLPLDVNTLTWQAYGVIDPSIFLEITGVPSKGWVEKCYGSLPAKKLGEILDHEIVRENEKVLAIEKRFPQTTMITGLIVGDEIIIIEGMHRALAIANSVSDARPCYADSQIVLALAQVPQGLIEALRYKTILGKG